MSEGAIVPKQGDTFAIGNVTKDGEIHDVSVARAQMETAREIEAQCILAHRFPRNEDQCLSAMLARCQSYKFAEGAMYSYPRGGQKVEGGNVHLARIMAEAWGNVRTGVQVVGDTPTHRKIRAFAWDLQSNTMVSREDEFAKMIYRQSGGWRPVKYENADDDRTLRELTMRYGAILQRECIFSLLPRDVKERCIAAIRQTVRKGPQGVPFDQQKTDLLAAFAGVGVTAEDIERRVGHKLTDLSAEELADLRLAYSGLKEGDAKKSDLFPPARVAREQKKGKKKDQGGEESPPDLFAGAGEHADTSGRDRVSIETMNAVNRWLEDHALTSHFALGVMAEQMIAPDGTALNDLTEEEGRRLLAALEQGDAA